MGEIRLAAPAHTKGPWIPRNFVAATRNSWIYAPNASGSGRICDLQSRKEVRANVFLIAAAPDLLEAGIKVLEMAEQSGIRHNGSIATLQRAVDKAMTIRDEEDE